MTFPLLYRGVDPNRWTELGVEEGWLGVAARETPSWVSRGRSVSIPVLGYVGFSSLFRATYVDFFPTPLRRRAS